MAEEEFHRIFVHKGLPDNLPELSIAAHEGLGICQLMVQLKTAKSNGEARRLIEGRAVEWAGKKVTDSQLKLHLLSGTESILKVGKKIFIKVKVV